MTEKHGYVGQKKRFRLRGWKKLPYALDDKISGGVAFVMPDMFRTLKFCNGRFKDDNPMFGNEGWKHLEILESEEYYQLKKHTAGEKRRCVRCLVQKEKEVRGDLTVIPV